MLLNKQDAMIYFTQKLKEYVPFVDVIQKGQSDLIIFSGKNVSKIKFLFSKDTDDGKGTSMWKFTPYLNQINEYDFIVFTTSNSRFSLFDFFILPNDGKSVKLDTKLKRDCFTVKRFDSLFKCDKINNLMDFKDDFNLLNISSGIESNRRFVYTLCIDCKNEGGIINIINKFNSSSNLIKILSYEKNSKYDKYVIVIESIYRVSDISKFIRI